MEYIIYNMQSPTGLTTHTINNRATGQQPKYGQYTSIKGNMIYYIYLSCMLQCLPETFPAQISNVKLGLRKHCPWFSSSACKCKYSAPDIDTCIYIYINVCISGLLHIKLDSSGTQLVGGTIKVLAKASIFFTEESSSKCRPRPPYSFTY